MDFEPSENLEDHLCVCPHCGHVTNLNMDCPSCDEQSCPNCGFEAMVPSDEDNTYESQTRFDEQFFENLGNQVGNLLQEKHAKVRDPQCYLCESCKTIVTPSVYEHEQGSCVKCGDKMYGLDSIPTIEEKRCICVSCNSSYIYEATLGQCLACGGMIQVVSPRLLDQDEKSDRFKTLG